MNSSDHHYCGMAWESFQDFVTKYMYFSVILVLETTGTPFSILTVIIFMRNALSPSNLLFASLAISDLMMLLLGIPQLYLRLSHNNIRFELDRDSYSHTEKIIDHYLSTGQKIFYNISLNQTTILAIWRYVAIAHPLKERIWCNMKITVLAILGVYVACFLYFIRELLNPVEEDVFAIWPNTKNEKFPKFVFDSIYIILKIIPCTIVAICTERFISILHKSQNHQKEMIPNFNGNLNEKENQMNRTTKMVRGITIFFLFNNTLLIVAKILIIIFGPNYEEHCSTIITCLNNLLVGIYTVIPFVVYYMSSQQFRKNFKLTLLVARWNYK